MAQWDHLLKNLGAWEGSFTRYSPQGELREDTPSLVTLEGLDENRTIRQTIQMFSADRQTQLSHRELVYSSLSRSVLVFETGAFSQGSMQYGPFSEFGAELGFIAGDRRLRLVQLFDTAAQLAHLTLIREHRAGTDGAPSLPLTPDQLVGHWQGDGTTLYPDFSPPDTVSTSVSFSWAGDRLQESVDMPTDHVSRTWRIDTAPTGQDSIRCTEDSEELQLLLWPEGASVTCPLSIPRHRPFALEAGWLVTPTVRHRMIRHYNASGAWTSLTLAIERKMAP